MFSLCPILRMFLFQVEELKKEVEKVREVLNKKDDLGSADDLREAYQQLQQKSLKLFEMAYKKVNFFCFLT